MTIEWVSFLGLLALALGRMVYRSRLGKWGTGILVVGLVLTVLWGKLHDERAMRQVSAQAAFRGTLPREGRPDGYVSSDKCQACHPNQYDSWHQSYHRTMTQYAGPQSVVGNFDNVTLRLFDKAYHLGRRDAEFQVELEDPDADYEPRAKAPFTAPAAPPLVQRRIGMLTGSHHMQVYWVPSRFGNMQTIFPFAWLIDDRRWVPFHQTFLRDPAKPPSKPTWNLKCINCHSTAGQPGQDPQTHLFDSRTGEIGIACEACHGPAAEHVRANQDPIRRYRLHASGQGDPTIVNPARSPSKVSAQVCGQCHSIKWISHADEWSRIGFRYRPGEDLSQTAPIVQPTRLSAQPWLTEPLRQNPTFLEDRFWSDGMVRVSGREYNGLIESPCYQRGELTCISCHSMHASRPADQLAAKMESNQACLQCHKSLVNKIAAHSHHPAGSTGSECYNCHMPYTTYGLLKAIRSHQITSPTVKSSLDTGRPNACNLCHLDQSLGWTAKHLSEWYGQPKVQLSPADESTSAAVTWLLKGDAGQRALIAWHMGWSPAKQTSGANWLAPFLAQVLDDPYSAVRYIALRSLRQLPDFQEFRLDFTGPAEETSQARRRVMELWANSAAAKVIRPRQAILMDQDGAINQSQIDRLVQQRDNRSMDLQE